MLEFAQRNRKACWRQKQCTPVMFSLSEIPQTSSPRVCFCSWCFPLQLLDILVCLPSFYPHRQFLLMLSSSLQPQTHFRIRTELLESCLYSSVFLKLLYNDFGFSKLSKLTKKAIKQTGVKPKEGETVWKVPRMGKNGDAGIWVSMLVLEKFKP